MPEAELSFSAELSFWAEFGILIKNKYGHGRKGFFMKNLKKLTREHSVLERMDGFLTNFEDESSVFFKEWTFFYKIWAGE